MSARHDFRQAMCLTFLEVCLDSIRKHSTATGDVAPLWGQVDVWLHRAWQPIKAAQTLDYRKTVTRCSMTSKALGMLPAGIMGNGKVVLAALLELGEWAWAGCPMERRKAWHELIVLVQEFYSAAQLTDEDESDDTQCLAWGEAVSKVVLTVGVDGMQPHYAAKLAFAAVPAMEVCHVH